MANTVRAAAPAWADGPPASEQETAVLNSTPGSAVKSSLGFEAAYGPMVYRLAMVYLGCRADAEDVTQEAFLRLLYKAPVFSGGEHEKRWLLRVTVNLCRDQLKGYLVLGGTPDDLGWMEWFQMDGDWFWHAENCMAGQSNSFSVGQVGGISSGTGTVVVDVPDNGDSDPAASGDVGYATEGEYTVGDSVPFSISFRPWVEAANAKLAEMGVVPCEPQVD